MSVYFIHLAACTTFDVGCNEVFHVWPPVMGLYELDGFCNPRMSSGFYSMKLVEYPPPKIVVFHNNKGVSLP